MKTEEFNKPKGRTDNLIMQELEGEMLIYDLENHKAYSLNHTSNLVYQNCDGEKEVGEISLILQKELNKPVNDEVVWLALEGLKKEGLVRFEISDSQKNLNRREVIKRMGLSSMIALPLVVSIVAPTAAHATSGVACGPGGAVGIGNDPNKTQNGGSCRGNGNCCSNNCCATAGGDSGICRDVC